MHLNKIKLILVAIVILIFALSATAIARSVEGGSGGDKRLDIFHYHNVGNIWLRISNYGFFGSGDDVIPQYPSLEYPGGSGIDYLYQGALWFGAQKRHRDDWGNPQYWTDASHGEMSSVVTAWPVIDTLVSVGFDGDADMYEFLPAYNELEKNALGPKYDMYQLEDGVAEASIRHQRTGIDDDGDGLIDEDPAGFAFPYRGDDVMPEVFNTFSAGNNYYHGEVERTQANVTQITDNLDIWFPFGFLNLGWQDPDSLFNFAEPQDDDGDGLVDEDGYPTSEQDFLGYYYDYSPFGTPGERKWGTFDQGQSHIPLNVRVRQASFQWSYEYIKNLVYLEFDITNMNPLDTLFDCAMAIYMDADVGPQSWASVYTDDVSSYVRGSGYEFAYTYDKDKDGGLTSGYVGCRVCSPDPEQLIFGCWTWEVGSGPYDNKPGVEDPANEKYWLMTHNTEPFDESRYTSLRDFPNTQINDPCDTRFLFSFYGGMTGMENPTDSTNWNLKPFQTMKIVAAIFPGENLEDLKSTSLWAKTIYRDPQTLTTVVLPDTAIHYEAPGPPDIPKMSLKSVNSGDRIDVYWNNRSEFTLDRLTVLKEIIGWQDSISCLDSYIDNYDPNTFPDRFKPEYENGNLVENIYAKVNPWTGFRLRHDFQGYSLWKAANSGEQDAFMRVGRWDKTDTPQDYHDYNVGLASNIPDSMQVDFGGQVGLNLGLPESHVVVNNDVVFVRESGDTIYWTDYYKLNSVYGYDQICVGDTVYGTPIYAADKDSSVNLLSDNLTFEQECGVFRNPLMPEDIYADLYNDGLVPLDSSLVGLHNCNWPHLGQSHPGFDNFADMAKSRLARRYYKYEIMYPQKGVENYIAVTTFDRGIPSQHLGPLESGRDEDANMKVIFAGPAAASSMDNIYVVPNPYVGQSKFDGRRANDEKGDRSRRIWFVNIPETCTIKIYGLAGDLIKTIEHDGEYKEDVINPSKASPHGVAQSGMHSWDLLSRNEQIIAPGVYLYSVKDRANNHVKVNKFVIIK
ncbi:MAG: hypothetical protein U9P79_03480 [Candidatus Cloacimonadota bacterium]|nr:hypothetical protein [Candidatus Cloacimonadota bacterium]